MNRNYLKFLFALLFSVALLSASASACQKEVRFQSNPHCGDCVNKIEKAFQEVDGVEKAHVCLESKTVKLTYESEKTSEAKLKTALVNLGYKADALAADFQCCKEKAGDASCTDKKATSTEGKAGCCSKDKKAGAEGKCSDKKEIKKS